eukprot:6678309-Alexandrium_andersonii.AAC.1
MAQNRAVPIVPAVSCTRSDQSPHTHAPFTFLSSPLPGSSVLRRKCQESGSAKGVGKPIVS